MEAYSPSLSWWIAISFHVLRMLSRWELQLSVSMPFKAVYKSNWRKAYPGTNTERKLRFCNIEWSDNIKSNQRKILDIAKRTKEIRFVQVQNVCLMINFVKHEQRAYWLDFHLWRGKYMSQGKKLLVDMPEIMVQQWLWSVFHPQREEIYSNIHLIEFWNKNLTNGKANGCIKIKATLALFLPK